MTVCSPAHFISCQPDETLVSLVITNRIINVCGFIVVIMLLMYSVLHCLYSVGNKIITLEHGLHDIRLLYKLGSYELMPFAKCTTVYFD